MTLDNRLVLAYAHGATDVPLRGETIGQMWDGVVAQHGGSQALVSRHQAISWSYEELNAEVDRCARGAGLRKTV